jgi:hypothetical protein
MLPRSASLVAVEQPVSWMPPSILRAPEVLTESEPVGAEAELKALQRHAIIATEKLIQQDLPVEATRSMIRPWQ